MTVKPPNGGTFDANAARATVRRFTWWMKVLRSAE
jgi:hypothetical protein